MSACPDSLHIVIRVRTLCLYNNSNGVNPVLSCGVCLTANINVLDICASLFVSLQQVFQQVLNCLVEVLNNSISIA